MSDKPGAYHRLHRNSAGHQCEEFQLPAGNWRVTGGLVDDGSCKESGYGSHISGDLWEKKLKAGEPKGLSWI